MESELPKAELPKRQRRWFQFSLRSLLIFTVVCAVASAWVARRIERKRKEEKAAAALIKLGGRVYYDYELDHTKPAGPDWLRNLFGEKFFAEVAEVDFKVKDAGPEWLSRIGKLTFRDTHVGDTGLAAPWGRPPPCSGPPQRTRIESARSSATRHAATSLTARASYPSTSSAPRESLPAIWARLHSRDTHSRARSA